jgi:chromosome segregation ATPase
MNISVNEMLSINKRLKFRGEEPTQPQTTAMVTEPQTEETQTGLNALQMQGKNNIAFQGVNATKLKNLGLGAMMAMMTLGGAATMTSCADKVSNYTEVSVDIDMEAITTLIANMQTLMQQMVEQQKVTNQQNEEMKAFMQEMLTELKNQSISSDDFYKTMVTYMVTNEASHQMILEQLQANGKTETESNKILQNIYNLMNQGKYEEALNKIYEILGQINDTISVGLDAIMDFQQQLIDIQKEMLAQGKITNSQLTDNNNKLDELIAEYKQGNVDANTFYANVYKYMVKDNTNQQIIINMLVKNGMTQSEANKLLQQLISDVEAGNETEASAFAEIIAQLGEINETVSNIYSEVQSLAADFASFHSEYTADKKTEFAYLEKLYKQGKMQTSYLKSIQSGIVAMNKNLASIKADVKSLKTIASDDTKFQALMEQLKQMNTSSADYQKIEEMFKLMNMNLTNVIEKSTSDITGAMKDVNNSISSFENTYIATEETQNTKLTEISEKLDLLTTFPGADQSAVADAINGLTDAVNNNTDAVSDKLDTVTAQLDKVLAQLDKLNAQVAKLSADFNSYNKVYTTNWNKVLAKLNDYTQDLADIKAGIAKGNASLDELKSSYKTSLTYLNALQKKADDIEQAIKDLQTAGGNDIDLEEFKAYMKERDEANYNKFVTFMNDTGLAKNVNTIKELLAALNDKIGETKDYSDQLNTIINKLDGIDFTSPDYTSKLNEIIEKLNNFSCNCTCTGNSNTNEGIIDDLDHLLS